MLIGFAGGEVNLFSLKEMNAVYSHLVNDLYIRTYYFFNSKSFLLQPYCNQNRKRKVDSHKRFDLT